VADQQLAGVVMWAYAGVAAAIAFVVVAARWLAWLEELAPGAGHPVATPLREPSC
jgi:cytochrome c oxidase assembly factor CtaG